MKMNLNNPSEPNCILDRFRRTVFKSHPVWILLGDIEQGKIIANRMIDSVKSEVHFNDIRTFDLSSSNLSNNNLSNSLSSKLSKFSDFLSLCPVTFKIAVCIIPPDYEPTALLKKLEDLPKYTSIIIVAQNISQTLQSRGGTIFNIPIKAVNTEEVFRLLDTSLNTLNLDMFNPEALNDNNLPFMIQSWLEEKMIHYAKIDRRNLFVLAYETWHKFIEVRNWLDSKQITEKSAVEMMISLLVVARSGLPGYDDCLGVR